MEIKKVGVLGCGLMGHGIAQVAAQAGYDVVVREVDQGKLDKGLGEDRQAARRAPSRRARLEQADADAVRGAHPGHARLRRPRRLRPRDRGDHRGPRPQARDVARGGRDRQAGGGVRHQHLVAAGDRPGRRHLAARALPRPALLQPGAGDEAGRGGPRRSPPPTRPSRSAPSFAQSIGKLGIPTARQGRASSSTGCSCPTCSTPSAPTRRAWARSTRSTRR